MTLTRDAYEWSEDFFRLVDLGDADGIAERVTDDAWLTSGNADPVVGKEAIRSMIKHFRTTITDLHHEIVRAWSVPEGVISELKVTYVRLDGGTLTLPCTNIFHIDDHGLVSDYKIYMDMAPVYA